MYTCASCTIHGCERQEFDHLPKNCPMLDREKLNSFLEEYQDADVKEFTFKAASLEADGYGNWPRLRETVEMCKRMGYTKVGMAFCGGLKREAKVVADVFQKHGIRLTSVMCKVGGYDKSEIGMGDEMKIRPGGFEPMCNPITQAKLLNEQGCEFNIILGLCVGHDSLFMANSEALCTTLVVKDRALGNNPCAAIYTAESYCKSKLY